MAKGEGMTKPNYQIYVIRVIHGSAPLLVFIRVNSWLTTKAEVPNQLSFWDLRAPVSVEVR
jgi:hypothetical protein